MNDGLTLKEKYGYMFAQMSQFATASSIIDETNVLQEANPDLRKMVWRIVAEHILPGSRLEGRENFAELHRLLQAGHSCVLMPEHYSNLDLPSILYLLEADGSDFGKALAEKSVAIAGMKLTEANPAVKAWTEGFARINIYPSRSIASIKDPEILARETERSKKINMASMRALFTVRASGRPVIIFPSGTRYRPDNPDTKRVLREADSYVRSFDYMALISINGSCLRINPAHTEDMLADTVHHDKVIVAAGKVINCKEFRREIIAGLQGNSAADAKQAVADKITALLEAQHESYEVVRQKEL
ncbi:MAG: 1-acyl-sn-glycerol-3-phosphate acyltransferase [Treponemataceae bacterium]|nr:MAG: 1-acyl-sn-glycerol-3-phosphate acyltransferase [Treponemataceae bacterium]